MQNDKDLYNLLNEWFDNNDLIKDHFWNRNKIGNLIRSRLVMIGKWKNRARGNPKLGMQKMLAMQEAKKIDKKMSW